MPTGSWLVSLVNQRLLNPFDLGGQIQLRTVTRDYVFEDGRSAHTEQLVGFLVGRGLVAEWSLGARAVLYHEPRGQILLTSEVVAMRRPEVPVESERREILKTNAAIPMAKMLREEQKKRVRPPSYSAPDLGSSTRVDLALLESYLKDSKKVG